jgi:D-lyxose ketol-isomerase
VFTARQRYATVGDTEAGVRRSEINRIMRGSAEFLQRMRFLLPPFAWWTPEDWTKRGPECREIASCQLGWDITDFGSGDFARVGLFLFTIRNGTLAELEKPGGKVYAEKILIVQPGQLTPTHFHFQKTEDIINRGGGVLEIACWNATADEGLAGTPVVIRCDGIERTVAPGVTVLLRPGESVCIPARLYHQFRGREGAGTVLVGEVSRVNDDRVDNRFHEPVGRFPEIDEDEPPLHLLTEDYTRYYRFTS